MSTIRRILVVENSTGHTRYYYSTIPLSEMETFSTVTDEMLESSHGQKGFNFLQKLSKVDVDATVSLKANCIKITKNQAFLWSEVEPNILKALKEIYGDFELKREPLFKRAIRALKRYFK